MGNILAIGFGGAIGALLRYFVSNGVSVLFGKGFPYGTLTVNFVGSCLIGILFVYFSGKNSSFYSGLESFLMVGLLGALTTFSTFSLDTIKLLESGAMIKAVANVFINVIICLLAAWLGILLMRFLND